MQDEQMTTVQTKELPFVVQTDAYIHVSKRTARRYAGISQQCPIVSSLAVDRTLSCNRTNPVLRGITGGGGVMINTKMRNRNTIFRQGLLFRCVI